MVRVKIASFIFVVLYFGNVYGSTWHQFDFSSIVDPLISYLGLGFGSAPNSDAIDEKTRLELLLSADDLSKAARNTIDLAPLTPGTVTYNKNAVLLVCRIIDNAFFSTNTNYFNKKLPNFAQLTELENFPEDDPSGNTGDSDALSRLAQLSKQVLLEYNYQIPDYADFLSKALYYNAAKWLEDQWGSNADIKAAVDHIIENRKAENLLYEIIPADKIREFIDLSDNRFKSLEGWLTFDDHYIKALQFIRKFENGELKNIVNQSWCCRSIETYEHLFATCDREEFRKHFQQREPWRVLRTVDRIFHYISDHVPQSGVTSLYTKAPNPKSIYLSQTKNDMEHLKWATIIFFPPLVQKLKFSLFRSEFFGELYQYSIRDISYTPIRYCAFQDLAKDLLKMVRDINDLQFDEILNSFNSRTYFQRLLQWYEDQLISKKIPHECHSALDELKKLGAKTPTKHILIEMNSQKITSLTSSSEPVDHVSQLMNLGKQEDDAVSTMMKLRLDELAIEYGKKRYESENQKWHQRSSVFQALWNKYTENIDNIKHVMSEILKFGWPSHEILCKDLTVYNRVLDSLDDGKFQAIFGIRKEEMLGMVTKALENDSPDATTAEDTTKTPNIDLTGIPYEHDKAAENPSDVIKNYKYTILLYCQILDHEFFEGKRPPFDSLTELEKFSANSTDVGMHDTQVQDDHPTSSTDDPSAIMNAAKKLLLWCVELVSQYNLRINTAFDYSKQAIYHNALTWLKIRIGDEMITGVIDEIIQEKKLHNYFLELLPQERRTDYPDIMSDKFKTLEGWKEPDEFNQAIDFIAKIEKKNGKNALAVIQRCTKIEVYERILFDADKDKFKELFSHKDVIEMLRTIDYSFSYKYAKNSSLDVSNNAVQDSEINLSDMQNDAILYIKHATILFVRAFETNFNITAAPYAYRYTLYHYSHRFNPYEELRYCTLRFWIDNFPRLLKLQLESLSAYRITFFTRAYLYRSLKWFKYHTNVGYKEEYQKYREYDMTAELTKTLQCPYSKHILQDILEPDQLDEILQTRDDDLKGIDTLEKLKALGKEIDNVAASMISISLIELHRQDRTLVESYVYALGSYGHPGDETKRAEPHVYKRLIDAADSTKFFDIFRMTPEQMQEKLENKSPPLPSEDNAENTTGADPSSIDQHQPTSPPEPTTIPNDPAE